MHIVNAGVSMQCISLSKGCTFLQILVSSPIQKLVTNHVKMEGPAQLLTPAPVMSDGLEINVKLVGERLINWYYILSDNRAISLFTYFACAMMYFSVVQSHTYTNTSMHENLYCKRHRHTLLRQVDCKLTYMP